uniref:hypothetical protein n=1 Tax=Nocardia abscessus TaxID=120957 RepID=UPI003CC80849
LLRRRWRVLGCFELSECFAQCGSLVLADLFHEVHQRGGAAAPPLYPVTPPPAALAVGPIRRGVVAVDAA